MNTRKSHTVITTPAVNGVYPVTTCLDCGDSVQYSRSTSKYSSTDGSGSVWCKSQA